MERKRFISRLGELYSRVGRPSLEGRFVALLLLNGDPIPLSDAAKALGVTKSALQRIAVAMLEKGDVKREGDYSTKRHLYSLSDHTYARSLQIYHDVASELAKISAEMQAKAVKGSTAAQKLRGHAEFNRKVVGAIRGIVVEEERSLREDLKNHLEDNWDAIPAKSGVGKDPDLDDRR